jgi:hypothetical protein
MWCIPEASAEYVACMEDVLDLYECMKELVDEVYPQADLVRAVLDNLGTHKPAAL